MLHAPGGDGGALGLTGAMVSYLVEDAVEEGAGSRFRRGDEVRFKVRTYEATHAALRVLES